MSQPHSKAAGELPITRRSPQACRVQTYALTVARSWPYNEVIFKASHNSQDRDERPITRQLETERHRPHQGGCRGLELDLKESPDLPMWSVDHDRHRTEADRQLTAFLDHLRRWSGMNPGHDVVTVHLDLKDAARHRRTFPHYLDATIGETLGRSLLYTPGDLMGRKRSLVAAAMASGWPTLEALQGRFILCLTGDERAESTKAAYAVGIRNRLCFVDSLVRPEDPLPSLTKGNRVFMNFDARVSWDWADRAKWFAQQRGFITRAFIVNDQGLWDRVVAADTNIVATDRIRNHEWAHVGDQPFRRISDANRPAELAV